MDKDLNPLPITDKIIKDYCGKTINFVELEGFTFGKELQLHVMELKANRPFESPQQFEETMQKGVTALTNILEKHHAKPLGTGMHPLLNLNEARIWPHRHRKIYEDYAKIFNMKQHGWLNIQSFHLNLPFSDEDSGVQLHNQLTNLCPYLPAISASSPIYEGRKGIYVDNRLWFYKTNQADIPSVSGDVVPEYTASFNRYKEDVINNYSSDLATAGAGKSILYKEWVNSRGVIFRFDRKALEVRVMDEQECIRSDVALSCFIRATLRGMLNEQTELLSRDILVSDFNSIVLDGLRALVLHPAGKTARDVCQSFFKMASNNATNEEKPYLWLIKKRIEQGNLSQIIQEKVVRRAQKTQYEEAVRDVYSTLISCLTDNHPFL